MSMSVHTCNVYQVEYAGAAIHGWDEIQKFLDFLRAKQADDYDGIWISENEEDVEIDFDTLELLRDDEEWGRVIEDIIKTGDKRNAFVRLAIF